MKIFICFKYYCKTTIFDLCLCSIIPINLFPVKCLLLFLPLTLNNNNCNVREKDTKFLLFYVTSKDTCEYCLFFGGFFCDIFQLKEGLPAYVVPNDRGKNYRKDFVPLGADSFL